MATVALQQLTKVYPGGIRAVVDFNLTIRDGECVALVGPSGCGKTTVLRLIAGLEAPTSGGIAIAGREVTATAPKDRDVAMVFQNYALFPHLTAYQNMAFGLKLRRCPRPEIDQRVRAAAQLLGIADLLPRRPAELSGGERQRVAVGRAIVRQPAIFLFDEPLSNLDAQLRVQLRAEFRQLHRRLGATMLYVTHDQAEALTLGERVVVMQAGIIQQIASPRELYARPANQFVAGFIGAPPMNLLPGLIEERNGAPAFCHAQGWRLPLPAGWTLPTARAVCLGLRPEDILAPAEATADAIGLRATITALEAMGPETHVYLNCQGVAFVGRTPRGGGTLQVGQEIPIAIRFAQAHLFDAETGRRLENGQA